MLGNFMPQARLAILVGALVVVIAAFGLGWFMGSSNQKVECEEARAKEFSSLLEDHQKQLEEYNEELKQRTAEADRATKASVELANKLSTLNRGVRDEIERRNPSADCGPSDRERSLYLEAARSTRDS